MKAATADLNCCLQFSNFISILVISTDCAPFASPCAFGRNSIAAALATVSVSRPNTRNQTPAQFALKETEHEYI